MHLLFKSAASLFSFGISYKYQGFNNVLSHLLVMTIPNVLFMILSKPEYESSANSVFSDDINNYADKNLFKKQDKVYQPNDKIRPTLAIKFYNSAISNLEKIINESPNTTQVNELETILNKIVKSKKKLVIDTINYERSELGLININNFFIAPIFYSSTALCMREYLGINDDFNLILTPFLSKILINSSIICDNISFKNILFRALGSSTFNLIMTNNNLDSGHYGKVFMLSFVTQSMLTCANHHCRYGLTEEFTKDFLCSSAFTSAAYILSYTLASAMGHKELTKYINLPVYFIAHELKNLVYKVER